MGYKNKNCFKRSLNILVLLFLFIIVLIGATVFVSLKFGVKKASANPGTCYWVGDTSPANWNDASHWSSSSGGTINTCEGGANVPGVGTAVVFDGVNNNSVTVDTDVAVTSITAAAAGYSGTFDATTHSIATSGIMDWESGSLTLGSNTWTCGSTWTVGTAVTLTAGTSTVRGTNGGAETYFKGGNKTYYDVKIAGLYKVVSDSSQDFSYSHSLEIQTNGQLNLATARTATGLTGATTTIGGSGIIGTTGYLHLDDSAGTNLDIAGTLTAKVTFDLTAGDATIPVRTYGSDVTFYNLSTADRTATLSAGTYTCSANFYLQAAGTKNVTVNATANPTVNITGILDFTGTGAGTESISMGSGNTWTVGGNVDLTNGTITAGSSTLILNGSAQQDITSADNSFNNLTIKNTHANGARPIGILTVAGNITVQADGASAVTLDNANNVTINVTGNLSTAGAGGGAKNIKMGTTTWTVTGNVDFTGGTVTCSTSTLVMNGTTKTITGGSNTLYNLQISGTIAASTSDVTVSAVLTIDNTKSFDGGSRTITLSGSGTPFVVSGTFTCSTSTISYTGAGGTNITSTTYYNLTINHAAVTFIASGAGDIIVTNVLTITAGTFDASDRIIILSGTTGTPFVKTGTFTPSASTIKYTGDNGGGNTNVVSTTYYNLYLDNASETFDAAGNITALGVFTINTGTFDAKDKIITLSGSGIPFVKTGNLVSSASTFKYTATVSTNLKTYWNYSAALGDVLTQSRVASGNVKLAWNEYSVDADTISRLRLDEGSGNPADSSGHNAGGTFSKATWVAGDNFVGGYAADLPYHSTGVGINWLLENLTPAQRTAFAAKGTVELWAVAGFNFTEQNTFGLFRINHNNAGGEHILDKMWNWSRNIWEINTKAGKIEFGTPAFSSGDLLNIELNWDDVGNSAHLFINGVLKTDFDPLDCGTGISAGSLLGNSGKFAAAGNYIWAGQIDDVRASVGVQRHTADFSPARYLTSGDWQVAASRAISNGSPGVLSATLAEALPSGTSLQIKLANSGGGDTGWQTMTGSGTSYSYDFTGTAAGNWYPIIRLFSGGTMSVNTPSITQLSLSSLSSTPDTTVAAADYYNLQTSPAGAGSPTYTFASGATHVYGAYTNGDGVNAVISNLTTNDPTFDVDGTFTNSANATFVASDSAIFSVAGNFTNSATGVFTDSGGTLTLDGGALQTITAGGIDASHDFNNLVVANTSGPAVGVSFADSATVTGTLTNITPSSKITFKDGATATYAFNSINLNGSDTSTRVVLASSNPGIQWLFNITDPTPSASYVSVQDSNASGGSQIDATTGGLNLGNNLNWLFGVASITISPASATLDQEATQLFAATAYDSSSIPIPGTTFNWSVVAGGGTIDNTGLFTAGTVAGTYANTIQATATGVNGLASVVVNATPVPPTPPTPTPTPETPGSTEIKITPIVPTETAPPTGEKKEDITLADFQFYVVLDSGNIPLTVNDENNLETVINSNMLVEISADIFTKKVNVITISTSGSTYLMNLLSDKNKYQSVIPMPAVKGDFELRILIVYEDGSLKEIKNVVSVDPQGYIYTLSSNYFGLGKKQEVRISDAKVMLYKLDGGEYKLWDSAGKQPNPTISNKSGEYAFWVPNGDYYLTIEKAGYKTVKTDNFKVENSLVIKNIKIEPTVKPWIWLIVILVPLTAIIYLIVRRRKKTKLAGGRA